MNIDDLVSFVRLETPGILDVIIVQAIAATAMDFCIRTKVWDEIQDPISLIDRQSQYDLDAPTDAQVCGVTDVWAADRELTPITMGALSRVLPNWQSAQNSQPQYYNTARDLDALTVYPIPLGAAGMLLTFRAYYAPRITSTTLPNFLAARYHDALISGAKARLMVQVEVPWSNPKMAIFHQGIYDAALFQAVANKFHDGVTGSVRSKPVRFG